MKIKINKKNWLIYSLLFLAASTVGGNILINFFSNDMLTILQFTVGLLVIVFFSQGDIDKKVFCFIMVMSLSMIATFIYTGGDLSLGSIGTMISRFILVYAIILIDKENIVEIFLKFAFFVCIYSLIFYFLSEFMGYSVLISSGIELKSGMSNFLFYNINSLHSGRNMGMFGEPGQYQIFVSVAIWLCVFYENKLEEKTKIIYSIVFFVTMITIKSTAGYMTLAAIVIALLIMSNYSYKKKIAFITVVVAFVVYILFFLDKNSILYYHLLGKIYDGTSFDLSGGSGSARTDSIFAIIEVISNTSSIILGIGYAGIEEINLAGCASLLNTLITFGIFTWLIMYGSVIYTLKKCTVNIVSFIVGVAIVLITGLSQPNMFNPYLMLMCYGAYFNNTKKIGEKND